MPPITRSRHLIIIFLLSAAALIYEIILTKLFSVTLWYHFSYLVISLAMFGFGLGGLITFYLRDKLKLHIEDNIKRLCYCCALMIGLSLIKVVSFHAPNAASMVGAFNFFTIYILCTLPFTLISLILAILFLNYPQDSPKLYAADLIGAAIGCLLSVVLISYLSAQQVIMLTVIFCVMAGSLATKKKHLFSQLVLLTILATVFVSASVIFPITHSKNYSEIKQKPIFEQWSPLSRITVLPKIYWRGEYADMPFAWGMSNAYHAKQQMKQLWIEQDASAGTPITPFNGDWSRVDFLKYDITALPYYLKTAGDTFILGVGGGRDVLTALSFKQAHVTGVDIHPVIVNLIKDTYKDYTHDLYHHPDVDIHIADGRTFLAQTNKQYDILQIPLIDSWAATVAGAFAMSENSLYTVEAFKSYLDHLKPNGILSVSRYYFEPQNQSLKIALLAREALASRGILDPREHLIIVKNTSKAQKTAASIATILVKNTPFTADEIGRIKDVSHTLQFDLLYIPHQQGNVPVFEKALTTNNLQGFIQQYYYDIRPNTDDRPFFFQMLYLSKVSDLLTGQSVSGQVFNYYGVVVLLIALLMSFALVCTFYLFPLAFSKRTVSLSWSWSLYFLSIGLAFMLVEIPLLHLGSVYLGSPTYGLAIALCGLLLFGGIGSFLSAKVKALSIKQLTCITLTISALLAAVSTHALHGLTESTLQLGLLTKISLFLFLLIPLALCMGVALPSGIRLAEQYFPASTPWCWAVNGAASVIGSILAMIIAIQYGYHFTSVIGASCYVFALALLLSQQRQHSLSVR